MLAAGFVSPVVHGVAIAIEAPAIVAQEIIVDRIDLGHTALGEGDDSFSR
jgi:hypothetical protein